LPAAEALEAELARIGGLGLEASALLHKLLRPLSIITALDAWLRLTRRPQILEGFAFLLDDLDTLHGDEHF